MSPPKLPRNTPVSWILHPSVPCIFLWRWWDDKFFIFYYLYHSVWNLCAFNVPLWLNERLNNVGGSLACTKSHFVVFLFYPKIEFFELFFNNVSAFESFKTFELASIFIDVTIFSENINKFEIIPLSSCIVVVIMCRSNFHATCAKFSINHLISDDFYFSVWNERM